MKVAHYPRLATGLPATALAGLDFHQLDSFEGFVRSHGFPYACACDYGNVNAVIESSVSGESRKPPAADVMTTYCLPFLA